MLYFILRHINSKISSSESAHMHTPQRQTGLQGCNFSTQHTKLEETRIFNLMLLDIMILLCATGPLTSPT